MGNLVDVEELHRLHYLVGELRKEIDYEKRVCGVMEDLYHNTSAYAGKLIVRELRPTEEIKLKDQLVSELENKASSAISKLIEEKESLRYQHIEEMAKMDFIIVQNARLKCDVEGLETVQTNLEIENRESYKYGAVAEYTQYSATARHLGLKEWERWTRNLFNMCASNTLLYIGRTNLLNYVPYGMKM